MAELLNDSQATSNYFKSRVGMVWAVALSYAGLGNVWRFPYLVGKYGGAAFLIPYFFFLFLVGWLLMFLEWGLGKGTRHGTIGAFAKRVPWFAGAGAFVASLTGVMMAYYMVIAGGWVLSYFWYSVAGTYFVEGFDPQLFWEGHLRPSNPTIWICWAFTVGAAAFITAAGIQQGFEKMANMMGPLALVLLIIIVIRSVTLPGSWASVEFYMKTDWKALAVPTTWFMALTQVFWSIGPGWGNALSLAKHARKEDDIPLSSLAAALGDASFAVIAGFAIFPAVFAFGLAPNSGSGLAFITLAKVFTVMPGGRIIGSLFFFALWLLALSSCFGFGFATIVPNLMDRGMSRKKASLACALVWLATGALFILNDNLRGATDDLVGTHGLMLSVLAMIAVTAWFRAPEGLRTIVINKYADFHIGRWWSVVMKYIAPGIMIFVLGWFLVDARGSSGMTFWTVGIGGFMLACAVFAGFIVAYNTILKPKADAPTIDSHEGGKQA